MGVLDFFSFNFLFIIMVVVVVCAVTHAISTKMRKLEIGFETLATAVFQQGSQRLTLVEQVKQQQEQIHKLQQQLFKIPQSANQTQNQNQNQNQMRNQCKDDKEEEEEEDQCIVNLRANIQQCIHYVQPQ